MTQRYWLLKTEPETYNFEQLVKDRKTNWNGIRNFQARNFLSEMKKGDSALIYHSGKDKSVVGIAKCVRQGYPDVDKDDASEWVQIDIEAVQALAQPVSLATIKSKAPLKDMLLVRNSRLSVTPVTRKQYETILKLGGTQA